MTRIIKIYYLLMAFLAVALMLHSCAADNAMRKGEKFLAIGEYHDAAEQFKLGKGTLVFPILQQEAGIVEAIIERSDIISQRIAIGRDSLLRAGDMAIAVCHLQCSLSA